MSKHLHKLFRVGEESELRIKHGELPEINKRIYSDSDLDKDGNVLVKEKKIFKGTGSDYIFFNNVRLTNHLGYNVIIKNKTEIPEKVNLPTFADGDVEYELVSFISHRGGSRTGRLSANTSGHYVCWVKRKNGWYLCNDADIKGPYNFNYSELQN